VGVHLRFDNELDKRRDEIAKYRCAATISRICAHARKA
jgi:hypothetical protein